METPYYSETIKELYANWANIKENNCFVQRKHQQKRGNPMQRNLIILFKKYFTIKSKIWNKVNWFLYKNGIHHVITLISERTRTEFRHNEKTTRSDLRFPS